MWEIHIFDGISGTDRIGVILKGKADLIQYNQNSYRNIIEQLI